MKKKLPAYFLAMLLLISLGTRAQMRNIYTDSDPANSIRNFSFYTPSAGYIASDKWIGFTLDSGRTITKKFITLFNVNYGTQFVNLTFGFTINGVHTFSQDTLIVYGNYGFEPSILYSVDGGNTFLLTYHQPFNQNFLYDGVFEVSFPSHSTGFAVIEDRVLQTFTKGLSWNLVYSTSVKDLFGIQFLDPATGFLFGKSQVLKTTNGGNSWQPLPKPNGTLTSGYFISQNTGWINQEALYQTLDGGQTWMQKNDPTIYNVRGPIHFINDSTGYGTNLFNTIKTSDSGKIWEPLERDNQFEYLGYGHNNFFFWDPTTFWAGGGHGFIELTTNGGGTTLPKALFSVDLSQLNSNNKIVLANKTKQGYSYRWFKNSSLFSTAYNSEYITNRLTIDTVVLIVQKGIYSDTAKAIIDTRNNPHVCFASFNASVDTASVTFSNTDTAYGIKHYWYFGDGTTDSLHAHPVHFYGTVGNYTVSHVTYNTIDLCRDSSAQQVAIARTRNCLVVDFTYTPDPFYSNQLLFSFSYDHTQESGSNALLVTAINWGDGSSVVSSNPHVYDSSKYYTACVTFKNYFTGCINTICKPVAVQMPTGCDADFQISNVGTIPTSIRFKGKPVAYATGKRHTWVVNNWNSTTTGNNLNFQTSFFKQVDGQHFTTASSTCDPIAYEICIDSLNKTMKHIVFDSLSGCTDTQVKDFSVPREMNIFIKAVPLPAFPQYVSFYAYQLSGQGDTIYYSTVWHIEGPGANIYSGGYNNGSYKMTYSFPYPGDYKVTVAANTCGNYKRELYYINYHVVSDGCGIFPPDFTYSRSSFTNNIYSFFTNNANPASNTAIWYWGDSTDNFSGPAGTNTHIYYVGGVYNVSLKYISPSGCVRQITKPALVTISCNGERIWLDSKLPQPASGIFGYQWQVNDGTGWVNVPGTGIYFYDNPFTAGPNLKRLTLTGAPPSFNGYQYRCFNGTSYSYFTIRYTNIWTGAVNTAWENPANWSCGFVPDVNSTVLISTGTNVPVLSTNTTIYNLVIAPGANLTVGTGITLTVLH
jgi:PKD repeat protein